MQVPFPADLHTMQASAAYEAEHCGACCYDDMWLAHAALGLAHEHGPPGDRCDFYTVCLLGAYRYSQTQRQFAIAIKFRQFESGNAFCRVRIYASLTPRKDAEMIIHGRSLTSHSFATALHAALRVLVDDLECPSFNTAVGDITHQVVDTRLLATSDDRTGHAEKYIVRQGQC